MRPWRRTSEVFSLRSLGAEMQLMANALVNELPRTKPAQLEPVGAPLQQFAECLSDTDDSVVLADRIRSLGAEPKVAISLGAAAYVSKEASRDEICDTVAAVARGETRLAPATTIERLALADSPPFAT